MVFTIFRKRPGCFKMQCSLLKWRLGLLIGFSICSVMVFAQSQIKGIVVSAKDQTPLAGATVHLTGSNTNTLTGSDGGFSIAANVGDSLNVTMIGYLSESLVIQSSSVGVIALKEDANDLTSVVVVGYGTQKKVNLTGAVTAVDMTKKEGQPITNASNALHGVPGLFVNLSNSQPGVDRATIRIRGIGTLNDNDPLVLVDGVEYDLNELNPNDIATVTILKDASAAIYGSRAGNGVILVTTKTGHGQAKINYNFYHGVQNYTYMPDVIWDPIEYMKLKNQALINEGKDAVDYSDEEIAEYEAGMKTDPITYPSSNWFDIALKNGRIQKHDVSISGSNDKASYRLSLGFLDRNGIMIGPGNHEKKYSIGLNTSFKVSKRLTVGMTLDGYYRNYTQPFYTSFWSYLMRSLPILTDTLSDGRFGNSWMRTPGRNNWENPRMIAYTGYGHKTVQRFVTSVFANYKLPFNLTYNIKFGIDKYDGLLEEFTPQVKTWNPKIPTSYINWNSPSTAPRSSNTDYNNLNQHFYQTLDWNKSFGDHHLSLMVGTSYDHFETKNFDASMTGYLDATLTALDAGTERYATGGNSTTDVLISYFGRANYDYKGKYLLEGILRTDGSSRFADGRRWGSFPGISAGWRLDKENFFPWKNTVNLAKVRASYGQVGNQAVPLYSYENSINLGRNYSFGGTLASGAAATAYTDPTITWETTTNYNVGLDLELLNHRLNFSADVYKKRTSNILRAVDIPDQVGGLTGPQQNIGVMDNKGVELTLGYHDHIGDFNYGVNGNISFNQNKVVDIDGQILYSYNTNLATITKEGLPIDSYYILDAIGIFQSDEEVANSPFQSVSTKAGYIKYRDVNNDGVINADDRVIIKSSSAMPKYTYGFNLDFGYKGLSLSAFFQGVGGLKIYPEGNLVFPFNNGAGATWRWAKDAWTPENTGARLPIVTTSTDGDDNFKASDFWLRDGSYLRMKNIQLAYELPAKWLNRVKISQFTIYVNAENYLTFSKYKDYDPETTLNVSSLYHYPMLKTLSGGVKITF
ncbi:TonB-linked outer membrane protein, SusC/RagA family [Arachidicoccus rhizosphaerae]|uniref:TonB-linked outer membrane protein, SusC/RagA family n=1 Tax=Arachidicoccus rhizosphaerae TaxID=551991 RepID=A0A1H4C7M3_9BACT|nr:TonB-dependent receptor [Arachidicoccus rhizosphaerae]SEA56303.1 TonB-linked outer membrane protein, SusC/RagA family [Arachidicoccus rhizosphaerae]